MENAIVLAIYLAVLLFSVIIHEIAHGFAALALGDTTAKDANRLTLNPIPHIDIVGTLLVPFLSLQFGGFLIGLAKPVPYDPRYIRMRNKDLGAALIGGAGPAANVAIALIFGMAVRLFPLWANIGPAAEGIAEMFLRIT